MTEAFMHKAGQIGLLVLLAPAIFAAFATVIVWDWIDRHSARHPKNRRIQ